METYPHARTAVVVVDCQEISFDTPRGREIRANLMSNIASLLTFAQEQKWDIFFSREAFKEDLSDGIYCIRAKNDRRMVEGSPCIEFVQEMHPFVDAVPPENIITKTHHSAFRGTDLEDKLVQRGTENVLVVGLNSQACLATTVADGRQDFRMGTVAECANSASALDEEEHQLGLAFMKIRGRWGTKDNPAEYWPGVFTLDQVKELAQTPVFLKPRFPDYYKEQLQRLQEPAVTRQNVQGRKPASNDPRLNNG